MLVPLCDLLIHLPTRASRTVIYSMWEYNADDDADDADDIQNLTAQWPGNTHNMYSQPVHTLLCLACPVFSEWLSVILHFRDLRLIKSIAQLQSIPFSNVELFIA